MVLLSSHQAKKTNVGRQTITMTFFVVGVIVISLMFQLLTLNEFISKESKQDEEKDAFIIVRNSSAMDVNTSEEHLIVVNEGSDASLASDGTHIKERVAESISKVIQGSDALFGSSQFSAENEVINATGQTLGPVPNRTIAIIIGSFRGGESSWQTMASNVLDPSSADLAILTPEDDTNAMNSSLYKRAKYKWTFKNYDDWGEAVDLINGTIWDGTEWRHIALNDYDNSASIFGGVEDYWGSGAIIFMIRWFLHNHIKENNLTERYDHFMVTRSDHYYQCTHNISQFSVGNRTLWIPPGQDYRGRTDRHLIAGSDDVLDAIDIFPSLMRSKWVRRKKGMNTEQLLSRVWEEKKMKVNYFDRVMFTTALPTDTTRWARAEDPVPGVPGLLLKYPVEYDMVQAVCPQIEGESGKEERE